ncbi:MAG: hypothetical protein OXI96_04800 [Acidimicrobiaceae bacterium]|nr:hypothetical protein [Acidimicrobiaceae bacterium]
MDILVGVFGAGILGLVGWFFKAIRDDIREFGNHIISLTERVSKTEVQFIELQKEVKNTKSQTDNVKDRLDGLEPQLGAIKESQEQQADVLNQTAAYVKRIIDIIAKHDSKIKQLFET